MRTQSPRTWLLLAAIVSFTAFSCASEDTGAITDNPDTPWAETEYSLAPAQSCEDVRGRILDATTEEILMYRYGSGGWFLEDMAAPNAGPDRSGGDEGPSDYTTTNVQEEGVDETDIIKTDGNFIYTTHNDELLILKSWPIEETSILARVPLTTDAERAREDRSYTWSPGLFLYKDRAAVFSSIYDYSSDAPNARSFYGTRVTLVDLTDRTAPTVERRVDLEGYYTDARMIDGTVYLVTNGNLYLPGDFNYWDYTWEELPGIPNATYTDDENERERLMAIARPRIRSLVKAALGNTSIDTMLPRLRTLDANGTQTSESALVRCEQLYLPRTTAQLGLLNLSSLDLKARDSVVLSSSLLARGWEVYASQDNLYIAMSSRWWWWGWGNQDNASHIHKFALSGPTGKPRYVASGKVDGWLLNQFSMSEHRGYLRVATTDNEWTWNQATQTGEVTGGNHLTIFEQKAGLLQPTGSVRNLAPGEQIFSARMLGDRGYLVTFQQTDPLFTFDLSDPYNPRLLGELKINGFSSYMHPVGENHLLTIGQDADDEGRVQGVHLQIFDVSDMRNPKRTHQELISTGSWSSWSEAMWDHHAFTYHPGKEVLAFPVNIYQWEEEGGEHFTGLLIYKASPTDGFLPIGRVNHADLVNRAWCEERYGDWSCSPDNDYAWWTSMRRSVFIEDNVFSLSDIGLKVNDLFSPENEHVAITF